MILLLFSYGFVGEHFFNCIVSVVCLVSACLNVALIGSRSECFQMFFGFLVFCHTYLTFLKGFLATLFLLFPMCFTKADIGMF